MRMSHARWALLLVLLCGLSAGAQQRPLLTEDVDIIPPGTLRIEAGIDFMQDAKFPLSGLTGDLTRVGVIGINVGLSPNVEFQIDGVVQNVLSINSVTVPPPIPLELASGRLHERHGRLHALDQDQAPQRDQDRPLARFSLRRAVAELERGARHRRQPDQRLWHNSRRQEVRARRARQHVRQPRPRHPDRARSSASRRTTCCSTAWPASSASTRHQLRRRDQRPRQHALGPRAARHGVPVGSAPRHADQGAGLRFDFAGIAGLTDFSPRSGVTFGVTYDTPTVFAPVK